MASPPCLFALAERTRCTAGQLVRASVSPYVDIFGLSIVRYESATIEATRPSLAITWEYSRAVSVL
jgi:hypothetical protein